MITAQDVAKAHRRLLLHAKLSAGGYLYIYQCVEFPELKMSFMRERRKDPEVARWSVGDVELESTDRQAVADAINRYRFGPRPGADDDAY
jgi:hypothetical protein